jgi:hypothetical protein
MRTSARQARTIPSRSKSPTLPQRRHLVPAHRALFAARPARLRLYLNVSRSSSLDAPVPPHRRVGISPSILLRGDGVHPERLHYDELVREHEPRELVHVRGRLHEDGHAGGGGTRWGCDACRRRGEEEDWRDEQDARSAGVGGAERVEALWGHLGVKLSVEERSGIRGRVSELL